MQKTHLFHFLAYFVHCFDAPLSINISILFKYDDEIDGERVDRPALRLRYLHMHRRLLYRSCANAETEVLRILLWIAQRRHHRLTFNSCLCRKHSGRFARHAI